MRDKLPALCHAAAGGTVPVATRVVFQTRLVCQRKKLSGVKLDTWKFLSRERK